MAERKQESFFRRVLWRPLRIVLLSYLGVVIVLMLVENFLVYPGTRNRGGAAQPDVYGCEDVRFQSADGTQLHGWFFEHPNPRAVVLYCHGNGADVPASADWIDAFSDKFELSIFLFDYRGYGQSDGKPSERGVLADGHAAHVWLANRTGKQLPEIVLMGRSLGGAVAVDLASQNGAKGLVLERTFSTMPDAAAYIYPFLPVRLVMRNRYRSIDKIADYHGPLLQSHGTEDEVVPLEIGKRLFDASPSADKLFIQMPGVGHNGTDTHEYFEALHGFIESLSF